MKIDANSVMEFLDQLKALVEDIPLTIRTGDDGFEDVVGDQVENICKAIGVFKLQNLTPLTPVEKGDKKYSRIYENLSDKTDRTTTEDQTLFKAEFYFAMKRVSKQIPTISDTPNDQLALLIEANIPQESKYKQLVYSNEFFYTSMAIIQEVVEEIIEQRAKAPQTKLFQ